jgi:tRNA(fMet)-specific endonuclease VapC
MYLLDTNIWFHLISKHSQKIVEIFEALGPYEIKLSSITLAELEYGASKNRYLESLEADGRAS